ncbi:Eco57I restriction-modification methylase domain-containing protein [Halococcus salsus]|uniref:Eco57I restriction-modification methylase domain-containing protein n=1 Tax=Halococcus salsus TaxID=2162894 RepID=UPI0013595E73|nr:TaqI-like C-terminal specificity domain-containing protein [Halococcus salsus]
MQDTTEFRTNRDLFSNHYLDEHLPETDDWASVSESEIQEAYDDIAALWERERDLAPDRNESQLEEKFIRPMFRQLGIPFEVEESVEKGDRRPDYGFFTSEEAAGNAFRRRKEGGDFYGNAVAVADAKRWGRKLDTRGSRQRDFENPSYQIHVYLQETPTTWAVLTNGEYWRLYYGPTSHRLDSYYEVDLPTILETGDLEAFKYFYLFFRHEAFLPDASGDCFLNDVYEGSNVFAEELGADLQDNIYDAIQSLAEGFLQYPENNLGAEDLDLIHDSSLIYLYRLIFVLYAESEGRDLLDTDNEIYRDSYSLNTIKQEVAEELDSDRPEYQSWQNELWNQIDGLFQLIDRGSESRGIPREDFYVPAYNGGLFRTNPGENDSPETRFLASHVVGDEYLAQVIELLTRSRTRSDRKTFVDYSSLDVRHLGSIYEGLLEYQLNVADGPLTLDNGEYAPAEEGDEVVVESGEVYLTTDAGERKATGSYYTPEYVVEYIVENTLGPLVEDIREDLIGFDTEDESGFAAEFAERVFDLKILDPAMGSGHFLTNTIDYLAREIIDAQERQAEQQGVETVGESRDINWARRQVAQQCIYGVDVNPLAVELAKVSLWLRTLAAEQPLAFLDHHLKTGNSLVGSDIEEIDELDTDASDGPNTSLADFGAVRRGTIDHLMDVYEEFIAIENTDLADVKEMERRYREIERDDLRTRLVAMANVETAEDFSLDLPSGAYERMARALDSADEWAAVEETDWFQSAQALATEHDFLHWKLEFPEAFYEVDGSDRANPGFDAVVGNPPYVRQEQLATTKDYLSERYEAYHSAADLYTYFIEAGRDALRSGRSLGFIVSNKFVHAEYGRHLRGMLAEDTTISQVVDFHSLPVFTRSVSAYPLILLLSKNQPPSNHAISVANIESLKFSDLSNVVKQSRYEVLQNSISSEKWRLQNPQISKVVGDIEREAISLSEYVDVPLYRGILTGLNDAFILNGQNTHQLDESSEHVYPLLKGEDVHKFRTEYNDRYLIRVPSGWTKQQSGKQNEEEAWEWFQSEYPQISDHLSEFQADARSRYDRGEFWWELRPCDYYEELERSKIIYPVISKGPNFTLDTNSNYINDKLYAIPLENHALLGVLNSTLAYFWIQFELSGLRGGYQEFRAVHVEKIPIDKAAAEDEKLEELGKNAIQLREELDALNLSLPDHLGNYADGEPLGERYQPPAGLVDSILTATAADHESLRIGSVSVTSESSKLVVRATARYKPDDPDAHETDRWGYTETEPQAAMEFVGLSEAERGLVEAFVPHAADEAGGFAGFRETATKSISPLDRLEALTLPKLADVEGGLERYLDVKERAAELNAKIEKTDDLIDQIVYELYGLTDEEIEIVEEAVGDD